MSPLGNLVIAYRTNLVVIVPKAFRTFHDQCPVHIRVLAVFTGTFGVKGGGRFRVTTFYLLTVVFSVVVALLGVFRFNGFTETYFLIKFFLTSTSTKARLRRTTEANYSQQTKIKQ